MTLASRMMLRPRLLDVNARLATFCGHREQQHRFLGQLSAWEAPLKIDGRQALRRHRRAKGFSQRELAERAGVSFSAVKAYEAGERRPSRQALTRIIDVLGIPTEDGEMLLASAGYAVDLSKIADGRYASWDVRRLAEEVEASPGPAFVTNQATDIICANRAFRRVVGLDLHVRLPDKSNWNFFARLSDPRFATRLQNWDDVVAFLVGIAKGHARYTGNAEAPAPFLERPLERFTDGDPSYNRRLITLWEESPVIPRRTRMRYAVRWWRDDGRMLRFACLMHVADIWQEFSWHDWTPEDAETFAFVTSLSGV